MSEMCWLNGGIIPLATARIHPLDRGLLFGDGLFETLRADAGKVLLTQAHLARLRRSAGLFQLTLPFSDPDLISAMQDLLAANRFAEARLRLLLTRGLHSGNLGLPLTPSPTVLITAEPLAGNLTELQTQGVKLARTVQVIPRGWIFARHKTLNRLPYLLAREQAQAKGADDALLQDEQGQVTETTIANLFLVQGRRLITPPLTAPILPGITRGAIIKLAPELNLAVKERDFPVQTLFEVEEIFGTGSVAGVVPVTEVDGQKIGSGQPGPITRELQSAYQAFARSKDPRV